MINNIKFKRINKGRFLISIRLGILRFVWQLALVQDTLGIASGQPFKSPQVLFWDFIKVEYKELCNSLMLIQDKFMIGDIYLFQSGNRQSYRAICIDLVELHYAQRIIAQTDYVDLEFLKFFLQYGYKTIRILEKSRDKEPNNFVCVINSPFSYQRIKSNCHALHLVKIGTLTQTEYDLFSDYKILDQSEPKDLLYEGYETQYLGVKDRQ